MLKITPQRLAATLCAAACTSITLLPHGAQADPAEAYEITRLGFTSADGAEYQRFGGASQMSTALYLNEQGQAAGTSQRYNSTVSNGLSAWIDDGTGPIRLGYFGVGYQHINNGYEESVVSSINEQGQVIGRSLQYLNGTTPLGYAAWIDNGTGPMRLGFTSGGYQSSIANALNDQGKVIGHSNRFSGATYTGTAAWIDDGTGPQRLGLTGGNFQRSDGFEHSEAHFLNEQNHVAGFSYRYNGSIETGLLAWIDNGSTLNRTGLTGGVYQRSDGYEHSLTQALNNQGQAVGYSERYSGTIDNGRAIWIDDGLGPTRLGFSGTGYQRVFNGYEFGEVLDLNDQGQAVGYSNRYNGNDGAGQAAWIDDGSGPIRLGLIGAGYQTSNGIERSTAVFLNEAGQVLGWSARYDGTSTKGFAGWFYDPLTGTTSELVFSVRNDGVANTHLGALLEDGTVLGTYDRYDGTTELGRSAFAWDATHGFVDLGEIAVSPDNLDWNELQFIRGASESGYLIGNGVLFGGSTDAAFLLTPVPEPSSLALLAVGGLALCRRRR